MVINFCSIRVRPLILLQRAATHCLCTKFDLDFHHKFLITSPCYIKQVDLTGQAPMLSVHFVSRWFEPFFNITSTSLRWDSACFVIGCGLCRAAGHDINTVALFILICITFYQYREASNASSVAAWILASDWIVICYEFPRDTKRNGSVSKRAEIKKGF